MINRVTVSISSKTKDILKNVIGKKLTAIRYIGSPSYALVVLLHFEDIVVRIRNPQALIEEPCTFPTFSLTPYDKSKDPFRAKYLLLNYNTTIQAVSIIRDKIDWEENGEKCFFNLENGVVFKCGKRNIVVYALNSMVGAICLYERIKDFESENNIEDIWGIEENMEEKNLLKAKYRRIFEKLE